MLAVPNKIMSEICCQCKKQRGKRAKPWRTCQLCKKSLCLFCAPTRHNLPMCRSCWNAEYEAKEKIRKETPIECVTCHVMKLPAEMANPYVPTICNACVEQKQVEASKEKARKEIEIQQLWKPGNFRKVVVDGYTYMSNLHLNIGDKVWLPASWLDEVKGNYGRKKGTVTSFISDYDGECKAILGKCD